MTDDLNQLLHAQIIANPAFLSATFSGRQKASLDHPWEKIIITPVLLKNKLHYQFNYYDTVKSTTKNYNDTTVLPELRMIVAMGFKNIYIRHENTAVQIQTTPKGKILVRNHAVAAQKATLTHNRTKNHLIRENSDSPYLDVLGFTDNTGQIKPTMQAKFKQINECVKLIDNMQDWSAWDKPISMIDCGSGNAYLTFAAFHYFQDVLKKPTTMTGIDINPQLIENSNQRARDLGWDKITFDLSNIGSFIPHTPPTIVLALHACDTATDECLMKAVQWQSDFILSVPCCHHALQEQLKNSTVNPVFKGVMKHGILRERVADIVTDTLRALLLEIMGYKTDVIQFVTTEHTARNVMIRARKVSDKPLDNSVQQYRDLKNFWNVTPYLETILRDCSNLAERLH